MKIDQILYPLTPSDQIQLCSLKSVYIEIVRDSKPFSNSASMEIESKQKLRNLSLLFFVNIQWPYCDM